MNLFFSRLRRLFSRASRANFAATPLLRPARQNRHATQAIQKMDKSIQWMSIQLTINCWFFSVTPFKVDQNKNQNRSIDKAQNLGTERRMYICKDPRQISGQRNISYTRYSKKRFTQIYRVLYGDAMLVLIRMSSNMADGNQQKNQLPSFATKA